MNYSDATAILERNPASDGRHIGQATSRIDATCFYANTLFLAMNRVRETYGGNTNQRSFGGDLWRPHIPALIDRSEKHVRSTDDFKNSLGDDAAALHWAQIEQLGQKRVQKALEVKP